MEQNLVNFAFPCKNMFPNSTGSHSTDSPYDFLENYGHFDPRQLSTAHLKAGTPEAFCFLSAHQDASWQQGRMLLQDAYFPCGSLPKVMWSFRTQKLTVPDNLSIGI